MISQDHKKGLRNPWLLGMLGLIVLVLGVNATFVWYATHNQSTLVDREYKTKDRKTNEEVLSEIGAQRTLAWQTSIKRPGQVVVNVPAAYEISVTDRDGKPVSGTMEVGRYRAADAGMDLATAFSEVSPGNYQGYITFPLKGYWELRIRIKRGEDVFEVGTERFNVAPQP